MLQKDSHGRQVRWTLRARNAADAIRERWAGAIWIIELVSTCRRDGKRLHLVYLFITTLRTSPKTLLRLVRQRLAIQNQWHWPRDTKLGADAHHYPNRTGAPVFSYLRTIVINLLCRGGNRSIRQGLRELAYDIKGMLALGGVTTAGATT